MSNFKVGDWVIIDGSDLKEESIHKLDDEKLYLVKQLYKDSVKLWQPTEGEWCWSKYDGLVQILKITDERYIVFPLSTSEKDCTIEYRLGGLEPFIGELPSFIKKVL